jgi:hypothetical protein
MAKLNRAAPKRVPTSPVKASTIPTGRTYQGAPGYARDPKSELFLLAVTNMVGEGTFYEKAANRDKRFEELVRYVAVSDPQWLTGFVGWLRNSANMRTASVITGVEGARAMLRANIAGGRVLVSASMGRADEPGEALAYWLNTYGRPIPKPIKRGLADAAVRLYDEYAYLKWDSQGNAVRFADVIDLLRPSPATVAQNQLFRFILDARHGHDALADEKVRAPYIPMIVRNRMVRQMWNDGMGVSENLPQLIKDSGLTWEDVLSALGSKVDKRDLWEALIPTMGYMALIRNLRNFDQAGVSDTVAAAAVARIADPVQVRRSRQLPFRFLSAYRAAPSLRWGVALERAMDLSVPNIPRFKGRTLVLVDRSGSMGATLSARSDITRADAAALFGAAIKMRDPGNVDLVQFGTNAQQVTMNTGDSLLRTVNGRFKMMGGTNTLNAVRTFYNGQGRVILLTDGQSQDGDPGSFVPASVPMYTWDLAGYRFGHGPSGGDNRHTIGGLNDAAFGIVPLLERGEDAPWPWEVDQFTHETLVGWGDADSSAR